MYTAKYDGAVRTAKALQEIAMPMNLEATVEHRFQSFNTATKGTLGSFMVGVAPLHPACMQWVLWILSRPFVLKATDVVTLEGRTRTAATFVAEAQSTQIDVATVIVNMMTGSTDTVNYDPE